jgi:hypothetical protein
MGTPQGLLANTKRARTNARQVLIVPAFEVLKTLLHAAAATASAPDSSAAPAAPAQSAAPEPSGAGPAAAAAAPGVGGRAGGACPWEWAERGLVAAMVVAGVVAMGILAAMSLSDDCGCAACQ